MYHIFSLIKVNYECEIFGQESQKIVLSLGYAHIRTVKLLYDAVICVLLFSNPHLIQAL
jgi:hypothetical protein